MSPGSHTPVLLDAAVDSLKVRADGVYVDCTYGRGGHSRKILARLGKRGRVIALDRDMTAIAAYGEIDDERLHLMHSNFNRLRAVLHERGVARVDGILFDLGVSSPQFDDAMRGFSFRFDAPLDMRMDTSRGATAAEWLATAAESEIREVIRNYGEERFAKQIAAAIVEARSRGSLGTTRQLAALVAEAVPTREPRQDPATRMIALRARGLPETSASDGRFALPTMRSLGSGRSRARTASFGGSVSARDCSRRKRLTMRSSSEWKLITTSRPPGSSRSTHCGSASDSSSSS